MASCAEFVMRHKFNIFVSRIVLFHVKHNMTTSEFIENFRQSNPRDLALQSRRYPDVDMPYALNQIQGWQTARVKLPSWAECHGLVYPPHLNMEQCSSEPAARYKQSVARRWLRMLEPCQPTGSKEPTSMADLTGGFGVDFSFVSRCFGVATYVDRNSELCGIVRGNLPRLGISNATVVCAESEECLATLPPQTMLFLDPARRDQNGSKTVFIGDCTPDVCTLLPSLLAKSQFVMVKLSPMLDWHKAVDDLHGSVREVHIVSVGGECKELLLVLSSMDAAAARMSADTGNGNTVRVVCADISQKSGADGSYPASEFVYEWSGVASSTSCLPRVTPAILPEPSTDSSSTSCRYLYEPNASIMKAGCFAELSRAYGVDAIGPNSHLFVSSGIVDGFPGRMFAIDTVTTMNKRQLRKALGTLSRANIAVRNFPMSVAELRKRLKLGDGGQAYIFATTTATGEHVLIVGHKF